MGNRAVITTAPYDESNVGIYVHWNGGRASIEGFLQACKELGYRDPTSDSYGMARLTQAIGNYFGGELSLGVDICERLDTDNGDNGTYLIGEGWKIVDRKFADGGRDEINPETTKQIALDIVTKARKIERVAA